MTKNFSKSEFDSGCGAEMPLNVYYNMQKVANQLQILRNYLGKPITINSGYRSQEYNAKIGGAHKIINGKNPLNNFIYCYARNVKLEVKNSIDFLIDTPLDLVDWKIDHSKREDVKIVRYPILEERQIDILVPPSERATVRWDKNPWAANQGSSRMEREPVFWLFPYWMGRYLEIIQN